MHGTEGVHEEWEQDAYGGAAQGAWEASYHQRPSLEPEMDVGGNDHAMYGREQAVQQEQWSHGAPLPNTERAEWLGDEGATEVLVC